MARLGIEPRLPEYIPGALPTELPSHRYQMDCLSLSQHCVNRLHIQQNNIQFKHIICVHTECIFAAVLCTELKAMLSSDPLDHVVPSTLLSPSALVAHPLTTCWSSQGRGGQRQAVTWWTIGMLMLTNSFTIYIYFSHTLAGVVTTSFSLSYLLSNPLQPCPIVCASLQIITKVLTLICWWFSWPYCHWNALPLLKHSLTVALV